MDPEVEESLNILRPPVQRIYGNNLFFPNPRFGHNEVPCDIPLIRDHRTNNTFKTRDTTSSSVSLILKKTDERKVFHEYPVLSYTDLRLPKASSSDSTQNYSYRQRPEIKVTVIPTNPSSAKRKKKNPLKRIQSTVSNQENSINAKNVYLVITDKKRNKVYELKTTGSAELSKQLSQKKNEEQFVKHNLSQLLKSLNMDTKKKKGRKKVEAKADEEELEEHMERHVYECGCPRETYNNFDNNHANIDQDVKQLLMTMKERKKKKMKERSESYEEEELDEYEMFEKLAYNCSCRKHISGGEATKSRVTITGKLGLNDEDQYVLKCDASIDDHAFPTMHQTHNLTMPAREQLGYSCECSYDRDHHRDRSPGYSNQQKPMIRPLKDIEVQADFSEEKKKPLILTTCSTYRSIETQCKPANFNQVCFSNIEKLKIFTNKDHSIQCDCDSGEELSQISKVKSSSDADTSKSSNPLVIISVYTKGESETPSRDSSPSRNVQNSLDKANTKRSNELRAKKDKKIIRRNENSPTTPEKSPTRSLTKALKSSGKSPVRNQRSHIEKMPTNTPKAEKMLTKTEKNPAKSRSPSPSRPPLRQKAVHDQGDSKTQRNKKEMQVKKSPGTNGPKTPRTPKQTDASYSSTESNCNCKPITRKGLAPTTDELLNEQMTKNIQKVTKGINTNVSTAKKIKGDSCKDTLASKKNYRHERIDAKSNASNVAVTIDGENEFYDVLFNQGDSVTDLMIRQKAKETSSYENVLYGSDEGTSRKRSGFYTVQKNDRTDEPEAPRLSGIVVRDSIELCHRKEGRSDSELDLNGSISIYNEFNKGNKKAHGSAPRKHHYRGDSCLVTNPVQRDKEIRELLGLEVKSKKQADRTAPAPLSISTPTGSPTASSFASRVKSPTDTQASSARNSEVSTGLQIIRQPEQKYIGRSEKSVVQNVLDIVGTAIRNSELPLYVFEKYLKKLEYSCDEKNQHKSSLEVDSQCDMNPVKNNKYRIRNKKTANATCECGSVDMHVVDSTDCILEHREALSGESMTCQEFNDVIDTKCRGVKPPCASQQSGLLSCYQQHRISRNNIWENHNRDPKQYAVERKHSYECDIVPDPCIRESYDSIEQTFYAKKDPKTICDEIYQRCNHLKHQLNRLSALNKPCTSKGIQYIEPSSSKACTQIPTRATLDAKRIAKARDILCDTSEQITCSPSYCGIQPTCADKNVGGTSQQSIYQPLTLDRNVNIFLHIENRETPCKQKPIILTRQQYDKVKRSIERACLKRCKRNASQWNCHKISSITVGQVRTKQKPFILNCSKSIQTVSVVASPFQLNARTTKPTRSNHLQVEISKNSNMAQKQTKNDSLNTIYSERCVRDVTKITYEKEVFEKDKTLKENVADIIRRTHRTLNKTTDKPLHKNDCMCENCANKILFKACIKCGKSVYRAGYSSNVAGLCCVCGMMQDIEEKEMIFHVSNKRNKKIRHSTSIAEVHFANVSHNKGIKQVTFSSTNIEEKYWKASNHLIELKSCSSDSLHTIFKGRRKSPTPNLGTSADSLSSEIESVGSYKMCNQNEDLKPRKAFLRRLMSCLVMRSKPSQVKFWRQPPKRANINSSIDSYHISTSLGALELSSSIYDTSVSFYSNHTILPIESKMKRGFLSSFRGFLSNRKS